MTEKEFLEKRIPFWLEDETLRITIPSSSDRNDVHTHLSKKFGYAWIFAIRGYWWPNSHVMLYTGNYETPNMTNYVCSYLFEYFKDINWIGLGCHIGKPGEIWKPKLCVLRDSSMMKDEIFNKQSEITV